MSGACPHVSLDAIQGGAVEVFIVGLGPRNVPSSNRIQEHARLGWRLCGLKASLKARRRESVVTVVDKASTNKLIIVIASSKVVRSVTTIIRRTIVGICHHGGAAQIRLRRATPLDRLVMDGTIRFILFLLWRGIALGL
jgi:hypothetical protein